MSKPDALLSQWSKVGQNCPCGERGPYPYANTTYSLPRARAFMSKHFVKTVGSLWARARLLSNGMSKPRPSKGPGPGMSKQVKTGHL